MHIVRSFVSIDGFEITHMAHDVKLVADSVPTVHIGDGSNVQDGPSRMKTMGSPVIINRNSTIGHATITHAGRIGDEVLIGNCAIVLDGLDIGDQCIVAAGSLVTPRSKIPARSVVMGNPCRVVRPISEKALVFIRKAAEHYRHRVAECRQPLRGHSPQ